MRDVHAAKGVTCTQCHGNMAAVANPARNPWVQEPRCDSCHSKPGYQFEQPGKLFRDSVGHSGVQCITCHGARSRPGSDRVRQRPGQPPAGQVGPDLSVPRLPHVDAVRFLLPPRQRLNRHAHTPIKTAAHAEHTHEYEHPHRYQHAFANTISRGPLYCDLASTDARLRRPGPDVHTR